MKTFNGIISVLLGLLSMYLMFIKAETDMDFISGFVVMMASIIFMLFTIMEERNDEIGRLRRVLENMNNKI